MYRFDLIIIEIVRFVGLRIHTSLFICFSASIASLVGTILNFIVFDRVTLSNQALIIHAEVL